MRSRILVGSLLIVGVLAAGAFASGGTGVAPARQWAAVNLKDPTLIAGNFVMGPVLFAHDDAKMARGEPCTGVYRFEPGKGPTELIVAFHCVPKERSVATGFTLTTKTKPDGTCILQEYQFAGDAEGHGVPAR